MLNYVCWKIKAAAEDNRTLLLYGICGGCLASTVIVALAAVCYLKKSKDRLLSIGLPTQQQQQ